MKAYRFFVGRLLPNGRVVQTNSLEIEATSQVMARAKAWAEVDAHALEFISETKINLESELESSNA
jgi:hypothetical protein